MADQNHLAAEEAWLLWACAQTPPAKPARSIPGAAGSESSIAQLCELADKQGVLGLLLITLEREGLLNDLSPESAGELRQTLAFLRRKSTLWQFECGMLLGRFAKAGLHPIVLKGAALQVTSYREPAERSFGDIDLLFPDAEVQPAMRVLEELGYVAPADEVAARYAALHFHYVMDKPNGFKVEVHWALERPDSPHVLDTNAFVANCVTVDSKVLGKFKTPRAEYAVVHLSVQNLENSFAKLSRLVDIDRLVRTPGFDWAMLQDVAKRSEARVVVHTSLRLAAELLGTPVPRAALEALDASSTARWHVATLDPSRIVLEQRAQQRAAISLLIDIWCRDSTRSRLKGIGELLRGDDLALGRTDARPARLVAGMENALRVMKLATYQLFLYGRRPFLGRATTLPESTL